MRKTVMAALSLLTFGGLAACSSDATTPTPPADTVTIEGTYGYRERIAVPPGAMGKVSLNDVSRMDAPSVTLAEDSQSLDGLNPPFSYALTVPADSLRDRMRYAVRAEIRGADGDLLWTTDTAHLIDPTGGDQTMDPIWLVRTGASASNDGLGGEWRVEVVNGRKMTQDNPPTIAFGPDGQVSGLAGCNRFSGTYDADASGSLDFGPLALTRRACIPPLGEIEAEVVNVLENAARYDIRRGAMLRIETATGELLTARRM